MSKLIKKLIKLAPEPIRHRVLRSSVRFPAEPSDGLVIKLANTKDELSQAFRILHDQYVFEGYMDPHPSGMRVTKYHALPTTAIIVAKIKDEVVGTISLIRETPLGVPVGSVYDLSRSKEQHARIGEISSLAIKPEHRGRSGELFFWLIKYTLSYCKDYQKLDAILIGVHPKWHDFYVALIGFMSLKEKVVQKYDFANGNPLAGYKLDLSTMLDHYKRLFGNAPAEKNMRTFMDQPMPIHFASFPDRSFFKVVDPSMSPASLEYFFRSRTRVMDSMSDQEKLVLQASYPVEAYKNVLPKSNISPIWSKFRQLRFHVACNGSVPELQADSSVKILDMSNTGILMNSKIELPEVFELDVQTGSSSHSLIQVKQVRKSRFGQIGGIILNADRGWAEFHDYLSRGFQEILAPESSPILDPALDKPKAS